MHARVQDFLLKMSEEFNSGDIESLFTRFRPPAAFYFHDNIIVISTLQDLKKTFIAFADGLKNTGLIKSAIKLHGLTNGGHKSMIADGSYELRSKEGKLISKQRVRYFLQDGEMGLRIQLIDHSEFTEVTTEIRELLMELS